MGGDNNTIDNRDAFKKVDYGLAAGTGIALTTLFIDVRYNLGLGNVLGSGLMHKVALENSKARNCIL